MADTVNKL